MPASCKIVKSLQGQIVLITGCNQGIGKECAFKLASYGAKIIFACRSQQRAQPVVDELNKLYPSSNSEFMKLDLGDLTQVKQFGEEFRKKFKQLDILLNNAGIMLLPERELTPQGFEMQLGTNHFGHFVLTNQLLPVLKNTKYSRIVNLTSHAHEKFFGKKGDIHFEDLSLKNNYDPATAYSQSKLANILFTKQLAKNLQHSHPNIKVVCLHPGVVRTGLNQHLLDSACFFKRMGIKLFYKFQLNVQQGAQTSLQCCLEDHNQLIDGAYYDKCKQGKPSKLSQDSELAEQFWNVSNQMTKDFIIDW